MYNELIWIWLEPENQVLFCFFFNHSFKDNQKKNLFQPVGFQKSVSKSH